MTIRLAKTPLWSSRRPRIGDYLLRIRDLNSKGGETAIYYLEADWARPEFTSAPRSRQSDDWPRLEHRLVRARRPQ